VNLEAWVYGWDEVANQHLATVLRERCGVDKVGTENMKAHEPQVLNAILDRATSDYVLIMHAGIEVLSYNFVELMYDFMVENPSAGLISPNREGEPYQPNLRPKKWWYDGVSGVFLRCGVRFDEEMIFSQWNDVGIGLEYQRQGLTVWRDQRVSVRYQFRDFGSRSDFYHSYAARNKLLLDTKWYLVGGDFWPGVEKYNASVPEEMRIPTMFDLATYRTQELEMFAESIETELHFFLCQDGGKNPNLTWENPVILERRGQ